MSRRFIALEMSKCREPADDRPLLWDGSFGTGSFSDRDIAEFPSMHAALNAADRATNARKGCFVSAIADGRKVRA